MKDWIRAVVVCGGCFAVGWGANSAWFLLRPPPSPKAAGFLNFEKVGKDSVQIAADESGQWRALVEKLAEGKRACFELENKPE